MSENICSVCGEKFEDEYFDKEQNKCILHSNKKKSKSDYKLLDYKNLCYSFKEYLNKYLDEINKKIEYNENANIYDENVEYKIENIRFPFIGKLWEDQTDIDLFSVCENNINISFFNCTFYEGFNLDNNVLKNNNLLFKSCKFFKDSKFKNVYDNKIELLECKEIENLDFSFEKFNDKVRIKNCNIYNVNFYNSVFNDLADFYNTTFSTTSFNKTDFNDISVFTEATFKEKVDFKYTTFNKLSIFRKTIFKNELNLTDSIFNVKGNFLGISSNKDTYQDIKVSNRETARIIKDSFEQQNNIIEANKYYAIEMKKREEELEKTKSKNFSEWLIFKIHGLTSNHSQDWLLALFWIMSFTFSIGTITNHFEEYHISFINLIPAFFIFIMSLIIASLEIEFKNILLIIFGFISYGLYSIISCDFNLYNVTNHINPFSVMNSWDNITFSEFIYKVIIAYLIYQLIISIRQNTRRK